jgi:hypothetical protein
MLKMKMTLLRRSLAIVSMVSMTACANMRNPPFSFEDGKLVSRLNDQELAEAQKELESLTDGNVPRDMKGGIVIDCHAATKLQVDKHGQQSFSLVLDHIYLGDKQLGNRLVKLVSPTLQNGGLDLSPTGRYRVFAVKLDDTSDVYYIWRGTVLTLQ